MTAIVESLARAGHTLDVVTALPWYRRHRIEDDWDHRLQQCESMPWGTVTRLHPFPTDKSNIAARAVAFGGFTTVAAAVASVATSGRQRPDVVLAMSPPLILGLAGWAAASRWRVPFVFNIQDVFPDVAVEVGAITNRKVIKAAAALERFLYLRSDAVTVLSDDLALNVRNKIRDRHPGRVRVIPNFVDVDAIRPGERDNTYRREFGLGDRTVVMYAGNLGYSQSVTLLTDAARRFSTRRDVVFVVNGEGSARGAVSAAAQGLDNVVMVPFQPKERLGEVLAAADIQTVLLKAGVSASSVPSKLYSILAAGRPCVASVDPGSEVERSLRDADGGIAVPPEDVDAFCAALERLLDDEPARRRMGDNGRRWVERWLTPDGVASAYADLFGELASAKRR
ncbi:MAG: glycosyltransferase family 4 protein [Microthrixaceae bacterium]